MIVSSSNHTKPFVIALGIAFTILTFSILGFALMNGGLDFRSKAAVGKCRRATLVNGKYSCLGKGEMLQGILCCPIQRVSPVPTPTPTPSSGSKMYYCVKPVNGLPFCKQTTAFYTNDAACQANVIAYGDEGNTGTCYTSLKSCKSACR